MLMLCFRFLLLVVITLAVFPPSLVHAQWSVTPRVYLEERYDDNIFLEERDEQDDFIVTISPGANVIYQGPTGELNVDYEFRRSFYSDFSELDFSGHRGVATARKDFAVWFGAGVRETLIRAQDPLELTGLEEFERPSIRTGPRNRYVRNIVEPEVTFRYAENRSLVLGYRNNLLRNKRDDIADQDENAINARLTFRINVNNGVEGFYEHADQNYDQTIPPGPSRDFKYDEFYGKYTYYFNPTLSTSLEYRYYQRDFERETARFPDYKVHDPRLGITWNIIENVSLSANAGYAIRDAENGDDDESFSGEGNLSGTYKRLTLTLFGETGFGGDFGTAEALGSFEFWRTGVNGTYQLLERLVARGSYYLERDRFLDIDRRDTLWNVEGEMSYQLFNWLFASFTYQYNKRDSNVFLRDYGNNRYFLRITLQYDIAAFF
ncbi:MAG: outer membrane beta-barrel protein [Candidatus Aenigmarchaeota archaeon]|nr:outer membrane beta-barrel protein [Candidatus Aenigmarchaeota archaeon]